MAGTWLSAHWCAQQQGPCSGGHWYWHDHEQLRWGGCNGAQVVPAQAHKFWNCSTGHHDLCQRTIFWALSILFQSVLETLKLLPWSTIGFKILIECMGHSHQRKYFIHLCQKIIKRCSKQNHGVSLTQCLESQTYQSDTWFFKKPLLSSAWSSQAIISYQTKYWKHENWSGKQHYLTQESHSLDHAISILKILYTVLKMYIHI